MPRRAAQPKTRAPLAAVSPAVKPSPKRRVSATTSRDVAGSNAAPLALREAADHFRRIAESLEKSLAEIPRAADFEPLAEHLYDFAQKAPALGASLREISDTLTHANHGFGEALLRLPRPEDYEPLAAPLREFARVSPALAEAMREVLAVAAPLATLAAPLAESVRGLAVVAARLEATGKSLEAASLGLRAGPAPASTPVASRESAAPPVGDEIRERVEAAHEAVLEALAGLPRASDYEPAAAQLRAIASVSPSLLAWLGEVPALVAPLTESIRSLQKAAADLKAARELFPSR